MNIIRRAGCITIIFSIFLAMITMHAMAQETGTTRLDSGDTAWVLVSAALVMLMTPAVGLFYGGMVRKKNVLAIIMQSFIILAIISIQWVLFGYSLAFGPDKFHGLIGGLEWIGLNGVGAAPNPDYAATIPASVFMIFQAMFAIITPALITGAFADRMKFSTMMVFTVLWAVNSSGADGLIYGNPALVVKQLTAIAAVLVYSILMTAIILKVLDATIGLRVRDEHELEGLDVSQHGEKAYL